MVARTRKRKFWLRTLPLVLLSGLVCTLAASERDALSISERISNRQMPLGTILEPVLADRNSDQIVGYSRCGDLAIWTGHYLAAEYLHAQDKEGLGTGRQQLGTWSAP